MKTIRSPTAGVTMTSMRQLLWSVHKKVVHEAETYENKATDGQMMWGKRQAERENGDYTYTHSATSLTVIMPDNGRGLTIPLMEWGGNAEPSASRDWLCGMYSTVQAMQVQGVNNTYASESLVAVSTCSNSKLVGAYLTASAFSAALRLCTFICRAS